MLTKRKVSAGGVIYRRRNAEVEVALTFRNQGQIAALPKGLVEKGESLESAASRELQEETGLKGKLLQKINSIDYWFYDKQEGARIHKTVHFFLFKHTGDSVTEHDWEVEEVKWVPIKAAVTLATYKGEQEIIKQAQQLIQNE